MTAWEYTTYDVLVQNTASDPVGVTNRQLVDRICEMGRDGWELTGVVSNPLRDCNDMLLFFKRPLEQT